MNLPLGDLPSGNLSYDNVPGGEEGRTSGWSAMDPSRRRITAPAINASSLSKQKNSEGNEPGVTKETMVSCFSFSFFFCHTTSV